MRGKKIVLTLIAVILVSPFIWSGRVEAVRPMISVNPEQVYGSPLEGENEFIIEIAIADVANLYAFGFTLKIAPLEKIITPELSSEEPYWEEGPFLKAVGDTYFAMTYDKVLGTIKFGCTLTTGEGTPGASGAGTLVQVRFTVLEAGETPLELEETSLYDSYGTPILHHSKGGLYLGPVADLVQKKILKNAMKVGETQVLNAKVKNFADMPLYVKANFQMMHEDGRIFDLWTGQNDLYTMSYDGSWQYDYPSVDGDFTGDGDEVASIADNEGMVGGGDLRPEYGFYIKDYNDNLYGFSGSRKRWIWAYQWADLGWWQFEDVTIPEGRTLVSVTMDVHAWSDRDLPSDMVDMYLWNGETMVLFYSLGYEDHLYNAYPVTFSEDVTAMFDSEAKINDAELFLEFFPYVTAGVEGPLDGGYFDDGTWRSNGYITYGPPHPEWNPGDPLPPPDEFDHQWHIDNVWEAIYIDSIHLTVETLPLAQPDEVIDLDPIYFGPLTLEDVGIFYCTCTVWFSYRLPITAGAPPWNPARKVSTFEWKVQL